MSINFSYAHYLGHFFHVLLCHTKSLSIKKCTHIPAVMTKYKYLDQRTLSVIGILYGTHCTTDLSFLCRVMSSLGELCQYFVACFINGFVTLLERCLSALVPVVCWKNHSCATWCTSCFVWD